MISQTFILIIVLVTCSIGNSQILRRLRNLPSSRLQLVNQNLKGRLNRYRERNTGTICYDIVGCFEMPHRRSPLQKVPESPDMLNTKFYLFTRNRNFSHPEELRYDDDAKSLQDSNFNQSLPLKMIIHGYMGKWTDAGMLIAAKAYLKRYDCNMILMDWSIGARGPHYTVAAANTEIVGRQLGILLLHMIKSGLDPDQIHLLGFSLGAHVAGSASEVLKNRQLLIGRISGLDAASPLFRSNVLREKHKKLDREDAKFVDLIHTDSSPSITDGFGLWEPLGHVDFFPNGGQEQPGCIDMKQSIITSQFDRRLTKDTACSHVRAWKLFQETLLDTNDDGCEFISYSCPGGRKSFERGQCFPTNIDNVIDRSYRGRDWGRFGENVLGEGMQFFATRSSPPYCGTQVQIAIQLSHKTGTIQGLFQLLLTHNNYTTTFNIHCDVAVSMMVNGNVVSSIGTVRYKSLTEINEIKANLNFYLYENAGEMRINNKTVTIPPVFIDGITLKDLFSNTWQFCESDTLLTINKDGTFRSKEVSLSTKPCRIK